MSEVHQDCSVRLDIWPIAGHINLRGGAEILPIVAQQLGQELPVHVNTMSFGEHCVYWLGPDEWLILTNQSTTVSLVQKLRGAISGVSASVTDVSGGQSVFRISGSAARNILSKGCTLDFSPNGGFAQGNCAQSSLAKTHVLLGCIEEPDCFEIIVRRSFSDYLMLWLDRAGAEFGLQIIRSQ